MRTAIVDGIFYPGQEGELRRMVQELLDGSSVQPSGASAIVVPHAGYRYTGHLAADGFKSSMGREIHTVVLLSPVTRDAQDGIFLCTFDSFQTPLGCIPVDREKQEQILDRKGRISINDLPFLEEHSIEVQLPFVQCLYPQASIVPIHAGKQNPGTVKQLSQALKTVFASDMAHTLFVVSTNTSPYLVPHAARGYADSYLDLVLSAEYNPMLDALQGRHILPIGTGCTAAVIGMAGTKPQVSLLGTADSGGERIVCYASLALRF